MSMKTKYIIYALSAVAGIFIIIYIISQAKKMQAAKRMKEQEAAAAEAIEELTNIKGVPDWNNSSVKTDITFSTLIWSGNINPTTNKTEQKENRVIKIIGGATQAKIQLYKDAKLIREAVIDFYDEKLFGFN